MNRELSFQKTQPWVCLLPNSERWCQTEQFFLLMGRSLFYLLKYGRRLACGKESEVNVVLQSFRYVPLPLRHTKLGHVNRCRLPPFMFCQSVPLWSQNFGFFSNVEHTVQLTICTCPSAPCTTSTHTSFAARSSWNLRVLSWFLLVFLGADTFGNRHLSLRLPCHWKFVSYLPSKRVSRHQRPHDLFKQGRCWESKCLLRIHQC